MLKVGVEEDEEELVNEDALEQDDEREFSGYIVSLSVTVVSRMLGFLVGIAAVMSMVMESEWERERDRDCDFERAEARAVVWDEDVGEKRGLAYCCCFCCCCCCCCSIVV